jgi:hypothetical protein
MIKTYNARDYLAAFEPWLLEDLVALPDMLEDGQRCADEVAYRLMMPINIDGKYPVEVWQAVHPLACGKTAPEQSCRREKHRLANHPASPQCLQ